MCINHRRVEIGMAEQILDRANVVAGLQQVSGKRMPQIMASRMFGNARFSNGLIESALQCALTHAVSLPASGDPIRRNGCRRKNIYPVR